MATPFLLIGLGNPGASYAGNRHNAGFMAVERIAGDYGFGKFFSRFGGALGEGVIGGNKTFAFLPLGYMNTSGGPAGKTARFYKIPPEQMFVFHDELDLPLGKIRVKRGGGHGGHNGLKSLDAHVGKDYCRVRIGIGHPGDRELVTPHVLSDFHPGETASVRTMLGSISRHLPLLLQGSDSLFAQELTRDGTHA